MEDNMKPPFSVNIIKPNTKQNNPEQAEISVKEFLDFLKTAYQVHDNLEGLLLAEGMNNVVDWIKLKGDSAPHLETPPPAEEPPVEMIQKEKWDPDINALSDKLNEVLTEGVMDSVLPYLVPTNGVGKKSSTLKIEKDLMEAEEIFCNILAALTDAAIVQPSTSFETYRHYVSDKIQTNSSSSTTLAKKKSSTTSCKILKTDSEVEIHVCDEIKGIKKDFICNQKLLVEQMGYFADVTKEQKLDDMDISVHCDIGIFEWLMKWVKRDELLEVDKPQLDTQNAIPILVSASFLQMDPLLQECLFFCHRNMNEILKNISSMSCLNDSILTRLAAMYTNSEVEALKDRKDKIQSRLFCKLIQSMCEVEPESLRGHYCSLAKIFKCRHCQQIIQPSYGANVPCIPSSMRLQFDGSIRSNHERDPNWDINEYIIGLHKNLKSWRKVYWKLWGTAHFLYCTCCKRYFCAKQEGWCRYHPDHPQFFTLDAQKPPLPVGRYPCCGERAYRFQLLDDRNGCYFKEHTISTKEIKDASIASMLNTYRNIITDEPPKLVFPDRLTRLVAREPTDPDDGKLDSKEVLWWDGLELIPTRPKMGLLGIFSERRNSDTEEDQQSESSSSDDGVTSSSSSSSSVNSSHSEESVAEKKTDKKRAKRKKKCETTDSKLWQHNLSARSNQDLQRTYEEAAFKQMSNVLNSKTMLNIDEGNIKKTNKHGIPSGGVWVRLESEWREKNVPVLKTKNIYTGKVKMKTSRLL